MSETPILDLAHDPPKVRRPWWAYAVGFTIGILLVIYLPGEVDGLLCFPILYASIAVHEFGHLIAARLVGLKAGGIAIGGLMIFKSRDRWVTRFEWRRILSGGLAKPLPKKDDFDPARHPLREWWPQMAVPY